MLVEGVIVLESGGEWREHGALLCWVWWIDFFEKQVCKHVNCCGCIAFWSGEDTVSVELKILACSDILKDMLVPVPTLLLLLLEILPLLLLLLLLSDIINCLYLPLITSLFLRSNSSRLVTSPLQRMGGVAWPSAARDIRPVKAPHCCVKRSSWCDWYTRLSSSSPGQKRGASS